MLDALEEAQAVLSKTPGMEDDILRLAELALVQLCQVVGEAANRVPQDIRAKIVDIPWRDVISLRNRLVHGYDTVDIRVVKKIVEAEFPSLSLIVRTALNE